MASAARRGVRTAAGGGRRPPRARSGVHGARARARGERRCGQGTGDDRGAPRETAAHAARLSRTMLFEPGSHEPPIDAPWDEERIKAGIRAIVEDAEAAFDDGWPDHPADGEADRLRTLYLGGAGLCH